MTQTTRFTVKQFESLSDSIVCSDDSDDACLCQKMNKFICLACLSVCCANCILDIHKTDCKQPNIVKIRAFIKQIVQRVADSISVLKQIDDDFDSHSPFIKQILQLQSNEISLESASLQTQLLDIQKQAQSLYTAHSGSIFNSQTLDGLETRVEQLRLISNTNIDQQLQQMVQNTLKSSDNLSLESAISDVTNAQNWYLGYQIKYAYTETIKTIQAERDQLRQDNAQIRQEFEQFKQQMIMQADLTRSQFGSVMTRQMSELDLPTVVVTEIGSLIPLFDRENPSNLSIILVNRSYPTIIDLHTLLRLEENQWFCSRFGFDNIKYTTKNYCGNAYLHSDTNPKILNEITHKWQDYAIITGLIFSQPGRSTGEPFDLVYQVSLTHNTETYPALLDIKQMITGKYKYSISGNSLVRSRIYTE